MEELTVAVFIAVIIGIVELAKGLGLSTKYSPLLSVILGIPVGVFYLNVDVQTGIVYGLIIGLSAAGLYSGVKTLVTK